MTLYHKLGDNFNAHLNMVPKFDQPFAALIEDLPGREDAGLGVERVGDGFE